MDSKWPKSKKSESAKNGKLSFVSFTASNQQELHSLLYNKYKYHNILFSASQNQYLLCFIFQILKISQYDNSSTLNMDIPRHSGSPAITSDQQISHNLELSLSKSIPSSPEIISAFSEKFNFDITALDAKYCTESSSESGSKKRKENHDSLSILEPESPGFSIIWSIIFHIANFQIALPEITKLRAAITKGSPKSITEAIANLIITPRPLKFTTDHNIASICDTLMRWKNSPPLSTPRDTDNWLVVLTYSMYLLSTLVKASLPVRILEDRNNVEGPVFLNILCKQTSVVYGPQQRKSNLDALYKQVSKDCHDMINAYCADANLIITAMSSHALDVLKVDRDLAVATATLGQLITECGQVQADSTTAMVVISDFVVPLEEASEVALEREPKKARSSAGEVGTASPISSADVGQGSDVAFVPMQVVHSEVLASAEVVTPLTHPLPSSPLPVKVPATPTIKLNLKIERRPEPPTPLLGRSYVDTVRSTAGPTTAPLPAPLDIRTWQVDTEEVTQEAMALRLSLRSQTDAYYSHRQCPDEDKLIIADVTAGDARLGTAQYGVIHRLNIDMTKASHNVLEESFIDNITYIVKQAGIPSDNPQYKSVDNGIILDVEWMQRHNTQLAITRDCHSDWPYNDGVAFKIVNSIVCGATCITDDTGVPVIYGETQRILGLSMSTGGHPKAVILQWLPNPVAVEKILDAIRWPNLAVVRGISQGFEDHAISTTALYAVQDYLKQIGCSNEHFMILYGTLWYEDPEALKNAPTAAAMTAAEGNQRKQAKLQQRQGTRVPELVLRIVFTSTAADCARGCDDELFQEIRRQFHDLASNLGPVPLCLGGFRCEVMASMEACRVRPWHGAETSKDTNATVITGIATNTSAADLASLLYLSCGQDAARRHDMYQIVNVIMVPSQVGKQHPSLKPAKAILVWDDDCRPIDKEDLLPLKARGFLGRRFDVRETLLPGLATFTRAGILAGLPPRHLRNLHPHIYEGSLSPPPPHDADDIYAREGDVPAPAAPRAIPSQYAQYSRRSTSSAGRGGRGPRSDAAGPVEQFRQAFVRSAQQSTKHGGSFPATGFWRPGMDQQGNMMGGVAVADGSGDSTATTSMEIAPSGHEDRLVISNVRSEDSLVGIVATQALVPSTSALGQALTTQSPGSVLAPPRHDDSQLQAILNMMSIQHSQTTLQHGQTTATLSTMSARLDAQTLHSARHTEATIARATLQAIGRELETQLEEVERETLQISGVLAGGDIPDWYRTEKSAALAALSDRGLALQTRKLAHEQQYHLLTAADDSVGARPS